MAHHNLVGSRLEHLLLRGDNTNELDQSFFTAMGLEAHKTKFAVDASQLHSKDARDLYADRHTSTSQVQTILAAFAREIVPFVPFIAQHVGVAQTDITPNIFALIVSGDGSEGIIGYASPAGEMQVFHPNHYPSYKQLIHHLSLGRPHL